MIIFKEEIFFVTQWIHKHIEIEYHYLSLNNIDHKSMTIDMKFILPVDPNLTQLMTPQSKTHIDPHINQEKYRIELIRHH